MSKIKRQTEQNKAVVEAVKEQQGIEVVIYDRGDLSVEAFMQANFGLQTTDEPDDEPDETILIDFI